MAYNAVNIGGIIHGNVNADVFLSIYSESIYCRNIGIAMCRPVRGKLSIKTVFHDRGWIIHVSYGALSIAIACGIAPLALSIPVVIVAAFFLLRMTENGLMKSDAAIAAMSASALAIGVSVTSLTTGMTTDVCSYMFGSILAMTSADVYLSVGLSVIVLLLFIFCYHSIFTVTFDESFARATGVKVSFYNTMIAILTAVTIVLGMQMMGAMLISSLVIFPALTSMRIWKSFKSVVISSGILAVICFCIGMIVSYQFSTPAGASVVLVNLCAFAIFFVIQKIREHI